MSYTGRLAEGFGVTSSLRAAGPQPAERWFCAAAHPTFGFPVDLELCRTQDLLLEGPRVM